MTWLDESDELIYVSERDGWRHLYLIDAKTGAVKNPITKGEYVVRGIDRIDEAKRQVWFRASGKNPDQDPYFVHYYRVNFDGTGLVALTDGNGSHSVQYLARSPLPDRHLQPGGHGPGPRAAARRPTASSSASSRRPTSRPWRPAAGSRPRSSSPRAATARPTSGASSAGPRTSTRRKKYPVIEQIYAGPQGSFVPKTFSPRRPVLVADRPGLHRRADGRHGDGQSLQGVSRRLLAQHQGRRLPRPDPLAPGRRQEVPVVRPDPRGDLRHLGRRPERDGRRAVPSRVLQGRGLGLRLPRQPDGQGVVERAVDGLPGRPVVCRVVEHRQRPPAPGQAAPDRRRDGHERPARVDDAAGRRPDQGRQGFRAAGRPQRQPRHGRRLRPAADARLLRPPPARRTSRSTSGRPDRASSRAAMPMPPDEPCRSRARTRTTPRASPSTWASSSNDGSELRGAIERYAADRGSLLRSRRRAGSPQRDERIREFTTQWLDQLGKLDFDRLEPGRQGRLPALQEPPRPTSCVSSRSAIASEPSAAPLVPFARRSSTSTRRGASSSRWTGRRSPAILTGLTKEIDDARRTLERNAPGRDQDKGRTRRTGRQPRPGGRRRPAEHAPRLVRLLRRIRPALHLVDAGAVQGRRPGAPGLCRLPPPAVRRLGGGLGRRLRPRRAAARGGGGGGGGGAGGGGPGGGGAGGRRRDRAMRPTDDRAIATARSSATRSAARRCSASSSTR